MVWVEKKKKTECSTEDLFSPAWKTHTHRHTHTDIHTDRHTHTHRHTHIHRHTDTHTHRHTHTQERQTEEEEEDKWEKDQSYKGEVKTAADSPCFSEDNLRSLDSEYWNKILPGLQ